MTTSTRKPRARKPLTDDEAADLFESAEFGDSDPVRVGHLHAMDRAREAVERAQADLDATVLMARSTGSTLAEVAIALRISPQAVSKRYPRSGAATTRASR